MIVMAKRSEATVNSDSTIPVEFYLAEIKILKEKNANLAKALSDSKIAYTHLVTEKDMIQQEYFLQNIQYLKLLNYLNGVEKSSRILMNTIVSSSNCITEILQLTNYAMKLKNNFTLNTTFNNTTKTPPTSSKMHAVKPMIDGHVIFSPTINLRRVTETRSTRTARESLNRSSSDSVSSTEMSNGANDGYNRDIFQNNHTNDLTPNNEELDNSGGVGEEYMDNSNVDSEDISTVNNGLETVQEEEEENLEQTASELHVNGNTNSFSVSGSNSQVPLLSGVFRDVRVFLSPIQTTQYSDHHEHINTERGAGRTQVSRSSSQNVRRSESKRLGSSLNLPSALVDRRTSRLEINKENENGSLLEESFNSTLHSPLLSSTNISSRLNQSPANININSTENEVVTNSISKTQNLPKNNNKRSTTQSASSLMTDYDPLEGSSTMLEALNDSISQEDFLNRSPPKPQINEKRNTRNRRSRQDNTHIKKTQKRTAIDKGKPVVSSKVAKVMLSRMSETNNKCNNVRKSRGSLNSISPNRLSSPKLPRRKSRLSLNSISPNRPSPNLPQKQSRRKNNSSLPKKPVKKSNQQLSDKTKSQKGASSPRKLSTSPKLKRPRRATKQISMKEPSLRKKLRGSR